MVFVQDDELVYVDESSEVKSFTSVEKEVIVCWKLLHFSIKLYPFNFATILCLVTCISPVVLVDKCFGEANVEVVLQPFVNVMVFILCYAY